MDKMDKANQNTVPVPKPRNNSQSTADSSKTSYENVSIDLINKSININADNLQNSVKPKVQDKTFILPSVNKAEPYRNVISEMNNLNNNIKNNTKSSEESNKLSNLNENTPKPIPAPRRMETSSGAVSKTQNVARKAPLPPENVKIETPQKEVIKPERRRRSVTSSAVDDVDFVTKPSLVKSTSTTSMNSTNSTNSSETSPKYNNPSPGALLKSISATSKLLSESISERVNIKTKEARHKLDKIQKSSRERLSETTKTATSRLKNVRMKLGDNFSLGRQEPKMPHFSPDRPQTVPPNDPIFNSITFHSPLKAKSNNSYNLATAESSYEIPKPVRSCASDFHDDSFLPTYEESQEAHLSREESSSPAAVSTQSDPFIRNSNLTQSLTSSRLLEQSPLPAIRIKNKSETNLSENAASSSSLYPSLSPITDDLPCPKFPPPVLNSSSDGVYGKLIKSNISSSTDSDSPVRAPTRTKRRKDYETTEIRSKPPRQLDNISTRATIDSDEFVVSARNPLERLPRVFSRDVSHDLSEKVRAAKSVDENPMKSDSWSFYDVNNDDDRNSSPEPIYANDVNCDVMEPLYGMICDMESTDGTLLKPQSVPRKRTTHPKTIDEESSSDVIREFDPLIVSTVDEIFANRSNELLLLETLLGEGTYGPVDNNSNDDHDADSSDLTDDDEEVQSSSAVPQPPKRQDSLNLPLSSPKLSKSITTDTQNRPSVIIHQNMSLRADSMENMLDEDTAVAPFLAKCDEEKTVPSSVDLSRPTPSQSNWFINDESEGAASAPAPSTSNNQVVVPRKKRDEKASEKVIKNVLKPPAPHVKDEKPPYDPPSYSEAIGEGQSGEKSTQKSSMKSMFSNVLNKMENLSIKRKPSFKGSKNDVKTLIEMIPKPPLTSRLILHEGHLIRLPSGVVDDILKEQHFRKAYIRERKFQAYFDKELKTAKENFPLEHITTVQCVSTHKFTNNSMDVHCFEITTSVPKGQSFSMSNPNVVMSNSDSGNAKSIRVCHLYGVGKESERYVWMQKLLDSMTDVFPTGYTCKFYRAGWCYLKNSITSQWSGAWILLQKHKRKLVFYSNSDMNLECLDLRKARCLVLKDSDDSIKNLHIEAGPMLMIDCPPFSMYMIMASPRETKVWRHIIKEVAHNNGPSLKEQQLTKDDVPVIVDKCINFIYAQGSMSEGIYRKSGSENSINKLLKLFRTDAFSVQITRTEYNEHDVSNVLKRFMRDLPERLLGKYAASFISVTEMRTKAEKIKAYKELLSRLPTIEYHTLKKLIGHLQFIQSQKIRNKMGVDNLAIIWGPTLLQDKNTEMQYSQKEADVIIELICLYKNLYHLTSDELAKEQIMLSVLQKYHAAAENLSDAVKHSGDLKVWITLDEDPDNDTEEKPQVNVTLTPTKTVYEVCKELASKMNRAPFAITLSEIILNGALQRPLHYSEKLFDIVLKWSYWPEADRKDNFLRLRPMKFLKDVERALKNLPSVSPNKELKFADCKSKSFKSYTLELVGDQITVMKKEKSAVIKVKEINLRHATAYIGCEKKRDFQLRWAITLIETDPNTNIMRTRDSPYIGHVIAGTNSNDSLVWYSSILHSLHGDNIMPNPEIVIE
ncbi:hypothetical protein HA402_006628 [Bradysia odoriphaga]|nr:hypothetical protein HA402_006628 [Bradysia odoriphaga]